MIEECDQDNDASPKVSVRMFLDEIRRNGEMYGNEEVRKEARVRQNKAKSETGRIARQRSAHSG